MTEEEDEGEGEGEGVEAGSANLSTSTRDVVLLESDPAALKVAKGFVLRWGLAFTGLMLVVWPILSLPAGKWRLGLLVRVDAKV